MTAPLLCSTPFERHDALNTHLCHINATLVILEIALELSPSPLLVQNVVSSVSEQVEQCQQLNRTLVRDLSSSN